VELQIHQRRGDEFHRGKALVIGRRRQQALQQVGRHRRAGLPVPGMGLQHLGTSSQCS
jgi:hypothetical protein